MAEKSLRPTPRMVTTGRMPGMFSLMATLGVKALRSLTWVTRRAARSAPEITATLRPTSRVSCARFWAVMVMASSSVTGSAALRQSGAGHHQGRGPHAGDQPRASRLLSHTSPSLDLSPGARSGSPFFRHLSLYA